MKVWLPRLTLFAFLFALICAPVSAQGSRTSKVDRGLRDAMKRSAGPQRVIIRTKPGYRTSVKTALRDHGDHVDLDLPSIDGLAADVHGEDIDELAKSEGVLSISADAYVSPYAANGHAGVVTIPNPRFKALNNSKREHEGVDAAYISENLRDTLGLDDTLGGGTGVGIAVIDSGVTESPDLLNRLSPAFYDFTRGAIKRTTPYDDYGHGTHVANLIASRFVGVAPNATIIGLKVLDKNGRGRTSDVLRAIEFATANRRALGIDVINLSLGHPILESAETDPLVEAVEHAVRQGIIVVISAGNFGLNPKTNLPGYAGITSPGNAPSAITVGAVRTFNTATRRDDRIAPYSSRGPSWYDGFAKPDVLAPGDGLLSVTSFDSTLDKAFKAKGGAGSYLRLSGTSMAAAVASGVAALVRAQNPALSPNSIKAILEFTAIPVETSPGVRADTLSQGAGAINADGAVALADAISPWRPVGSYWLRRWVWPRSSIAGDSLAWSQSIVWRTRRATGWDLLAINRTAWSQNIIWGNNDDGEDNIIWGNLEDISWTRELVFNDDPLWAKNIIWGNNIIGTRVGSNVVWGTVNDGDGIVWGNVDDGDNILRGNSDGLGGGSDDGEDNIIWGNIKGVLWAISR